MNLLSFIPSPYAEIGAAVALLGAGGCGAWAGSQHEHRTHVIREANAAARIEAARVKLESAFNTVSGQLATDQQTQTRTFTEIRNVAGPIIYRSTGVCLGNDAVQLLDRAAAAANDSLAGQPAPGARSASDLPAQP